MSLNNLNAYQKPVVDIATMCIKRLAHGDLQMDIPARNAVKRSRDWKDLDGNEIDDRQMCTLSGLTRVSLLHLWNKYKGDCVPILTNHGIGLNARGGRSCSKYRDRNGKRVGQMAISKSTGIGRSKLNEIFTSVNYDHIEAFKIIDGMI